MSPRLVTCLTIVAMSLAVSVNSRVSMTKEIFGATVVVEDPTDTLPVGIGRGVNAALAAVEAASLIGGVAKPDLLTAVAPIGLRDREAGTVSFTTSLGFGKKLERIDRNPRVALAYHAREHGFAQEPRFVLVQGTAEYDREPSQRVLDEQVRPASTKYMGPPATGFFWDRWLSVYYADRVLVTVKVPEMEPV